jgi:hypothetical protein
MNGDEISDMFFDGLCKEWGQDPKGGGLGKRPHEDALSWDPAYRAVYDVEINDGAQVSRIVEGIITVTPQVTR